MSYTRYIQQDRAWRLRRRRDIPYYSARKGGAWCYDDEIDVSLERLIQKFANYQLKFRYHHNDETVTRRAFFEVLHDMTVHYNDLDIASFEDDYNTLQREWLLTLQKKLRAHEKLPHHTDIVDACEELALCNEIYEFLVKPNQAVEDCWHVHDFDSLLSYLLDMPYHFSVTTFEDEYSRQQLELIQAVKDKLLSLGHEKDLFKRVRIKSSQKNGIIVDISARKGRLFYLIEDDEKNDEGIFPIHDCLREDLIFE